MDGTLLNSKHELHPDFFPLFSMLKKLGIEFAAASGRQYFNIRSRFPDIAGQMIFIAENGSYVVAHDEELFVQAMDPVITKEQLIRAKQLANVYPILCGKSRAYVDTTEPEFIQQLELYYERYEVVNDITAVENDDFLKIALCDMEGSERNSLQHFQHLQDVLQVKVSGQIWLDLSHKLANKGRALEVLQKKMGITKNETMAFGDFLNDIEMMEQSSFSFAMKNAHPRVKEVSRFEAKSNDENGVLEILHQLVSHASVRAAQ